MAENDIKAPLLGDANKELLLSKTAGNQFFKSLDEISVSLGMKDDFTKAMAYIRNLKPAMIDTPFKGSSLVMTKDEKFFVFGSREGRLAIADRSSNKVIVDKDLKQGSIWNLTLVENDKYVLTALASGNIKKYLLLDLSEVDEYVGHTDELNFIQPSSDERFLYSCADDRTVREWDLTKGKGNVTSTELYTHEGVVYCIDLSLDGTHIMSGSGDHTAKVYNIDSREVVAHLTEPTNLVWCVKISAMKNFVVAGDEAKEIHLWKFGTWELLRKLLGHTARVRYMDMAKNESFLVTAGLDHTIKIWDLQTERREITLKGHKDWVKYTLLSQDQSTIFSISDDCKVASWRVPKFDHQLDFKHEAEFEKLEIHGGKIYAKTSSGFDIFDAESHSKIRNIDLSEYYLLNYSFGKRTNKLFVVAKSPNKLLIYDLASDELLNCHEITVEDIYSAVVFPNEEKIAIGSSIRIFIHSIPDFRLLHTFRSHKGQVEKLAVTRNNLQMFSLGYDNQFKFYDMTKNEETKMIEFHESIRFLESSPDSQYLFIAYETNNLVIYSIKRMKKVKDIRNFNSSKIFFTTDGKFFVYNKEDTIEFRDMANLEVLYSIKFNHKIDDFCLSEDETLIYSTSGKESTVFSNPDKCKSISIFGDMDKYYGYIEYIYEIMHSTAKHNPEYDYWIIEPFHINTLHLYAYYNQPTLMAAAILNHSPFYLSRTRHSPLDIALDKKYMDCVEAIFKSSKARMEAGDYFAFYYFGNSLIKLNLSEFDNLHRIYEFALQKDNDKALPMFIEESRTLPIIIESDYLIIDPDEFGNIFTDEGKAIEFGQSTFKISLNAGSQDSTDLLESMIDCQNEQIFSTLLVKKILEKKWKSVQLFLITQAIFYMIYLGLLMVYSTLYYGDINFVILPFLVSLFLFLYELVQMYYDKLEYFEDPWNWIDLIRGVLLILHVSLVWAGTVSLGKDIFIVLVFFSWLRGISYFRIVGKLRYLINLITETTIDIIAFFIILFYSTLAFAMIYETMDRNKTISEQFLDSFKLNLGDLNRTPTDPISWGLFLVVSIVNPVILLNLLISIMSDTYGRVKEGQDAADSRELAGMILEVEGIMGWKRSQNHEYFVKILCEEGIINYEDDSVEGKLRELKDKMQSVIENLNSSKTEIIDSLNSAKERIIREFNS